MSLAQRYIVIGAVLGALGVAAGAFGAHGLENPKTQEYWALTARDLATYETAARYQMYHAPAIVLAGLLALHSTKPRAALWAGGLFTFGVLIFSGLLYALVFSHVKILGMIVPIGGTALIVGWIMLAVAAGKTSPAK